MTLTTATLALVFLAQAPHLPAVRLAGKPGPAGADRRPRAGQEREKVGRPTLLKHPENARILGFSRDARTLVTVAADNTVRSWDVASGETAASRPKVAHALLSGDGTRLVVAGARGKAGAKKSGQVHVELVDATHQGPIADHGFPSAQLQAMALAPDGRRLAIGYASAGPAAPGRSSGMVVLADLGDPAAPARKILITSLFPLTDLAFASAGETVAVICPTPEVDTFSDVPVHRPLADVALIDVASGQVRFAPERVAALDFSADGRSYAAVEKGPHQNVTVRETATGRQQSRFLFHIDGKGDIGLVSAIDLAARDRLAIGTTGMGARITNITQLGSQGFTSGIYRITRTYYRIEWKPAVAGSLLVRDAGNARGTGASSAMFSLGRGGVSFIATSGDGTILAAGSSDTPEIGIWRLDPLGKKTTVRGTWQAVLSHDGARLATLLNERTVAIYDL